MSSAVRDQASGQKSSETVSHSGSLKSSQKSSQTDSQKRRRRTRTNIQAKEISPDDLVLQLPEIARYVSYASEPKIAEELMMWADACEKAKRTTRAKAKQTGDTAGDAAGNTAGDTKERKHSAQSQQTRWGGFHIDIPTTMLDDLPARHREELFRALTFVKESATALAHRACFGVRMCAGGVWVAGADFFIPGESIKEYLSGAREVYLFAVTFPESDELIARAQAEDVDLAGTRAQDSTFSAARTENTRTSRAPAGTASLSDWVGGVCTEIIERAADVVEAQIVQDVCAQATHDAPLYTNARYSPGYGDVPLDIHPEFIRTLLGDKLGIRVLPTNFLAPSRSITALIGVYDNPPARAKLGCAHCGCQDVCAIRKSGHVCYARTW